jgi:hypothetical protein
MLARKSHKPCESTRLLQARPIESTLIWKSSQVPQRGSPGSKVVDGLGRYFGHGTRHILALSVVSRRALP